MVIHTFGDARLALLKAFAAPRVGDQAVFEGCKNLRVDIRVVLAHGAALGMAEDDVFAAGVEQHVARDLAGVSAGSVGVAVFSADADSASPTVARASCRNADGRHAQRNVWRTATAPA